MGCTPSRQRRGCDGNLSGACPGSVRTQAAKVLENEELDSIMEITKNDILSSDNLEVPEEALDAVVANIKSNIDKLRD